MPSRRQERVAKRVIEETTEALRMIKDPRLGFVTVTSCEVSPDLRHAKIGVSVLGSDEEKVRSLGIIKNFASRMRGKVGRSLGLKATPDLHFALDSSVETADSIGSLIRNARMTDANPEDLSAEEQAAFIASMAQKAKHPAKPADDDGDAWFGDEDEWFGNGDEDSAGDDEATEEEQEDDADDPDWRPVDPKDI